MVVKLATAGKLATADCVLTPEYSHLNSWRYVTLDSHLFCENMNITPSIAPMQY